MTSFQTGFGISFSKGITRKCISFTPSSQVEKQKFLEMIKAIGEKERKKTTTTGGSLTYADLLF